MTSFADLGLRAELVAALAAEGINEPFPIQAATIRDSLAGRDVCGRAKTGSGKTLAFGLPMLQRTPADIEPGRPVSLVLVPTRELARQVVDVLSPLARALGLRTMALYGGTQLDRQIKSLRRPVHVIVATPGRLIDLIDRNAISMAGVEMVTVDEADRMADMGFFPQVEWILRRLENRSQTLLFSATLDGAVDVLVRNYQREPVRCDVAPPERHDDRTVHDFVETAREQRVQLTAGLVREHGSAMVFCRTKRGADRVAKQLANVGVSAVAIHGDRSQGQRDRALASFQERRVQALVATDVAARGIHVDDVGCVVHFDIPADAKDYLHRSGRTGRAGAAGVVVTFVIDETQAKARELQRALGMPGAGRPRPASKRPSSEPSPGRGRRPGATRRGGRRPPRRAGRG